jgi:hypothetical protein
MKRLAITTVAVAALAVALEQTATRTRFELDGWLLCGIGLVSFSAAAVVLVGTHVWSWRAVGVFGYLMGGGLIFGVSGVAHWWYAPWLETIANLGRASLIIGAPLLLLGVLGWYHHRWPGVLPRRHADTDASGELHE